LGDNLRLLWALHPIQAGIRRFWTLQTSIQQAAKSNLHHFCLYIIFFTHLFTVLPDLILRLQFICLGVIWAPSIFAVTEFVVGEIWAVFNLPNKKPRHYFLIFDRLLMYGFHLISFWIITTKRKCIEELLNQIDSYVYPAEQKTSKRPILLKVRGLKIQLTITLLFG